MSFRYDVLRAQTEPLGLAGSGPLRDAPRTGADGEIPAWLELLSLAGAGIGAYHGYKRDDSVGWAIVWGVLGGMFPIIVIPVAFAQGIDKRKRG